MICKSVQQCWLLIALSLHIHSFIHLWWDVSCCNALLLIALSLHVPSFIHLRWDVSSRNAGYWLLSRYISIILFIFDEMWVPAMLATDCSLTTYPFFYSSMIRCKFPQCWILIALSLHVHSFIHLRWDVSSRNAGYWLLSHYISILLFIYDKM